jgi:hypothetical protein
MVEPLYLLSPVPGEVAGVAGGVLVSAIAALWKRGNTLQDRQQQRDDANLTRVIDIVERVIDALDENTQAIKDATRV